MKYALIAAMLFATLSANVAQAQTVYSVGTDISVIEVYQDRLIIRLNLAWRSYLSPTGPLVNNCRPNVVEILRSSFTSADAMERFQAIATAAMLSGRALKFIAPVGTSPGTCTGTNNRAAVSMVQMCTNENCSYLPE